MNIYRERDLKNEACYRVMNLKTKMPSIAPIIGRASSPTRTWAVMAFNIKRRQVF